MRDIQTIEQVHVHPGDELRGWDRMVRCGIFKQLSKLTYTQALETDKEGWMVYEYSNN